MHTPHRLTFYGKKSQLPAMLAAFLPPVDGVFLRLGVSGQ